MPDAAVRLSAALAPHYRLERELGRGGMATVYLAEDVRHRRKVAVKVLDPELAAAIGPERFRREIETIARLSHPHILPLHDSGETAGCCYYVMPYVEGRSLHDRLLEERQLPVEEALRIAREVGSALAHAHRHGVVHRDVKPENILLQDGQALVADFGLARAMAVGSERLTATGMIVGTPAYMSPEQAAGGEADARTDVYALGCVVYEMLAGQAPYTGPTSASVIYQHLNAPVPHMSALRPSVPAGLDRVVARAMAKAPVDRYASAEAFIAALEKGLTEVEAPASKDRRAMGVALSAVLVVAALTGIAWWQAWGPFAGGAKPVGKRDWILVAEFDSAPQDTMVAMASHDLLSAALDQSRIVATVPPDQIRLGLRMAGKPANARLDAELARELAYRSSVRAVLEGRVGRLGKAYSMVLRLVDADSARVILTETATAPNEDALIPAIGDVAKRLRRGLGEHRGALAATREMRIVATPSFEAYRLFAQAQRTYYAQTANRRTLRLLQAAVGLDPDFSVAWIAMGVRYANLTYRDSARICYERAARRSDRLTDRQRQGLEALRAGNDGDRRRTLEICDGLLAEDPNDPMALMNSSDVLIRVGRFEEAVDRMRRVMASRPFGPIDGDYINLGWALQLLGRFDEAREAVSHQRGIFRASMLTSIEMSANRWAVAESIATRNIGEPRWEEDVPGIFLWFSSRAQLARGAPEAAGVASERAVASVIAGHDPLGAMWFRRNQVGVALVSEGRFPPPPDVALRDTSITSGLTRGLRAALAGDLALARRSLITVRSHSARELAQQGAGPSLLESRIAMREGRASDAVALLRPLAAGRVEDGLPDMGVGLTTVRWSLADAFERLGQPDSAIACLEQVMSVPMETELWPFVRLRLVRLQAAAGQVGDAERHLAAVEATWDRAEPATRRMLDEARAMVAAARGMSRPRAIGS